VDDQRHNQKIFLLKFFIKGTYFAVYDQILTNVVKTTDQFLTNYLEIIAGTATLLQT